MSDSYIVRCFRIRLTGGALTTLPEDWVPFASFYFAGDVWVVARKREAA